MDQNDDPRELERKIEQASRIASTLTDQSTELRQGLRQRLAEPRAKEEINARARELWEHVEKQWSTFLSERRSRSGQRSYQC
jgi:hypothetical protein